MSETEPIRGTTVTLEGRMERGRRAILIDDVGVGTLLREKFEELNFDLDTLYSNHYTVRVTLEVLEVTPRPEPPSNVRIHRTPTYDQWAANNTGWIEDEQVQP